MTEEDLFDKNLYPCLQGSSECLLRPDPKFKGARDTATCVITIDHGTSALVEREERSSEQIFDTVNNKQTLDIAGDAHVGKDDLQVYASDGETLARTTNTQTLGTAGGVHVGTDTGKIARVWARINKTRRL